MSNFTNSSLVKHTRITPNRNSPRNQPIRKITIHHTAGVIGIENLGGWFSNPTCKGSSNYGIGSDGRVGMYVEEKDRAWTSSSAANDHQAVTIEVSNSATGGEWPVSDLAYAALIDLCADICKRNGIPRLVYDGTANGTLTRHNMFANTNCPGAYLQSRFPAIADAVNKRLGGASEPTVPAGGTQASVFAGKTNAANAETILELARVNCAGTGIFPSVKAAQFILESGYGTSELAQAANNCFGMKESLSGNSWGGSVWDGKSVYEKVTAEQNPDGSQYNITAKFRKYPRIEDSMTDHTAYLIGAKSGSALRYAGLTGCADYTAQITLIKNGGYATDVNYVTKVCDLIKRLNLDRHDKLGTATPAAPTTPASPFEPYLVRIQAGASIYKGAGANTGTNGSIKDNGVYTIVEEADGDGKRWGRLKSGAGWVSLSSTTKTGQTGTAAASTSAAPALKPIDEIAREVIAGKWGNGQDRVNRLTAAGYNASTVQSRVNQFLK